MFSFSTTAEKMFITFSSEKGMNGMTIVERERERERRYWRVHLSK